MKLKKLLKLVNKYCSAEYCDKGSCPFAKPQVTYSGCLLDISGDTTPYPDVKKVLKAAKALDRYDKRERENAEMLKN